MRRVDVVAQGRVGDSAVLVIFDMGGVLTVDPFEAVRDYAVELGLPAHAFVDQLRGPAEIVLGEQSIRDFLKFACHNAEERWGASADTRRLADCLAAGLRVRPEMVVLVGWRETT